MAVLAWNDLSWDAFVAGLQGYRDGYSGKDREDLAYFRALDLIQGAPVQARPAHSQDIVRLLNTWACRLSSTLTPGLLADWLGGRLGRFEALDTLTVLDSAVLEHAEELGALHDDLIVTMRAGGVHNMSDAAASKTLHVLIPGLFVMWDKEIRRSAPTGYASYMREMHALAIRLAAEAPVPARRLEGYLQELLGYGAPKTVAKYLDEYNWFEAVGRPRDQPTEL
jgi:hypothetical protein